MKSIYEYEFEEKGNQEQHGTLLLKKPPMVTYSKQMKTMVYECETINECLVHISYTDHEIVKATHYKVTPDQFKEIVKRLEEE